MELDMKEPKDTVMEDNDIGQQAQEVTHTTEEIETAIHPLGEDKENTVLAPPVVNSPSKLPRPLPPTHTASPLKSFSLLSPQKSLGSLRKPPVAGSLFSSPAKAFILPSNAPAVEIGTPVRAAPVTFERSVGVMASPKRPMATIDEMNSQYSSPKRLKTAISMPTLSMGSPLRPSTSSIASSTSPSKSSLRSPVKQPGISPKKSVTFHHPDPPPPAPVEVTQQIERPPGILDGLVFFLDLVNQQGADSNYLFAPLVEELGGECVPHWTSNALPVTHVVFMNGNIRTLEKVVASNGEVECVNISWLLE
jgi:hypothetical protein